MLNKVLRYASLLAAAVMLISCSGQSDDGTGSITKKELKITADKKFVQAFGGDYVTLTVTLGDEVKTEGVTFFDQDWNMIEIEDFKFMTDKPGDHRINAEYGTYSTKAPIKVTALAVAIPENPQDSAPQSVDFESKVLMVQHTTTGCTACPQMKTRLKSVLEAGYDSKVVKVDCHNGVVNRNDPAYVYLPNFGSNSFPYLSIDLFYTGANNLSEDKIKEYIDTMCSYKEETAAGIAVSSELKDDQIVTKVVVKPSVTGEYNIGIMLLEDNIVGDPDKQQDQVGTGVQPWMNIHNSCIRYMEAGAKYNGLAMGVIEVGNTQDYVFVFNLADIWAQGRRAASNAQSTWSDKWVEEELHFAVFVTTYGKDAKGSEFLYVSNVIDCPVDGVTPFQYKK